MAQRLRGFLAPLLVVFGVSLAIAVLYRVGPRALAAYSWRQGNLLASAAVNHGRSVRDVTLGGAVDLGANNRKVADAVRVGRDEDEGEDGGGVDGYDGDDGGDDNHADSDSRSRSGDRSASVGGKETATPTAVAYAQGRSRSWSCFAPDPVLRVVSNASVQLSRRQKLCTQPEEMGLRKRTSACKMTVALSSFEGSGNHFARYLMEQSSRVLTGSKVSSYFVEARVSGWWRLSTWSACAEGNLFSQNRLEPHNLSKHRCF